MKLQSLLPLALVTLLAACGASTPDDSSSTGGDTAPVKTPTSDENDDEMTVVDVSDEPDDSKDETPDQPVSVECVSQLVTGNGNYYSLTAEISAEGALVEMVQYRAATPTSDPVEEGIWTGSVDAEFTAHLFAFQAEEQFLEVEKSAEEEIYRGTMSGQSEFEGPVEVWCWPNDLEHPARYDAQSGGCMDELGEEAWNEIPWMVALQTGFGQCARFEGQLNGEAFGYPVFDLLDLRGADFNNAALHFADLLDSQLEGADLRQFDFGYATVSGTIDEHTQLPAECEAVEGATTLECSR